MAEFSWLSRNKGDPLFVVGKGYIYNAGALHEKQDNTRVCACHLVCPKSFAMLHVEYLVI